MRPPVHLVLVRSIYPANIGYCSRAICNMGANRLILINPQCDVCDYSARQSAAGGQEPLLKRTHYKNWQEFHDQETTGIKIALTRRDGKKRPTPVLTELFNSVQNNYGDEFLQQPIYLIMGPEDVGLAAKDLEQIHFFASLPTSGEFGSLNLAHASLLSMYIVNHFYKDFAPSRTTEAVGTSFTNKSFMKWLECLGMDLSIPQKNIGSQISRMLYRALPTEKETELWEKVVNKTIRKLIDLDKLETDFQKDKNVDGYSPHRKH